ncbi:MAG: peptidase M23 [Bacteroidetes bacterium]|nr:MAG: peptidase M23 [Bacteroidota bacterium]
MTLENLLKKHRKSFHPLFEPDLTRENTSMIDFSIDNPEMKKLDFSNVENLNSYVFENIQHSNKTYGYGGYLEDREIYRRSPLFSVAGDEVRSIHLGIDVWAQAGQKIYCPLDGQVHSFANNDNYGDYGPTIILQHQLEGTGFYTLFGHLDSDSLYNLFEGKKVKKGEVLCRIGNFPVNGDWPPHLHFQIIADMGEMKGDYPGVCSIKEKEKYVTICPNPIVFFNL